MNVIANRIRDFSLQAVSSTLLKNDDKNSEAHSDGDSVINADSIDLSDDGNEQNNSSIPNMNWLKEAGTVVKEPEHNLLAQCDQSGYDFALEGSSENQSKSSQVENDDPAATPSQEGQGLLARESAYGPNNQESVWLDPAKFRLPEDKTITGNRKTVSDTLVKGLNSLHNKEIKEQRKKLYNDNILKIGELWWNCIYCGNWKGVFADCSKNKAAELKVVPTEKTAELTKTLNNELRSKGIEVLEITPYIQKLPNENYSNAVGHEYAYLRVSIKGDKDLWMFTETNASKNPEKLQGNIRYQAYPVKNPDMIIEGGAKVR